MYDDLSAYEGKPVVGPNGERGVIRGGVIVPATPDAAAPAGIPPMRQIMAIDKTATPQTQAQDAYTRAQTEKTLTDVQSTQLQMQQQQAQIAQLQQQLALGNPDARAKLQDLAKNRENVEAATRKFAHVQGLYDEGYKGGGFFHNLGEVLPDWLSPKNAEFDAAAKGLSDTMLPVIRIPGSGTQTEGDAARFVQGNEPQARDFDTTIKEKLSTVRNRLDAARASVGLPPLDQSTNLGAYDKPGSTPGQTLAKDGTKDVMDPAMKAIGGQVGRLIAAGAPDAQVVGFLRDAGVDPASTNIDEALQFRRSKGFQQWKNANPHAAYPIGPEFYTKKVPLTGAQNFINKTAQSPLGTFAINAGEGVTGNRLDNIAQALGGADPGTIRAGEEMLNAEHPVAAFAGNAAGQIMDEAALTAIPGGRALAAMKYGRPGMDVAYGAYSGSGASDDDPLSGAAAGAIGNFAAGRAGRAIQRGVGNAMTGIQDPVLDYLNNKGVSMTLGDMAKRAKNVPGRFIGWTEDRLAGLPGTDAVINTARKRGVEDFNRAMFKDAAPGINGTGDEGLAKLGDAVSDAYKQALTGVTVQRDPAFETALTKAVAKGSKIPNLGQNFVHHIGQLEEILPPGAPVDGERLQAAFQLIKQAKADYKSGPMTGDMRAALTEVQNALKGMVGRQAKGVMPALAAADRLNANKKIVQGALKSPVSQRNDVLTTPERLNSASIQNTTKFGGQDRALSPDRPFYDLTTNAMQVLPNQIPDSGTAGRMAILPLLAAGATGVGATAGGFANGREGAEQGSKYGAGLGMLALGLMPLYSKGGQKVIQKALLSERPAAIDYIGELLKKHPELASYLGSTAFRTNYAPDSVRP
jgi:hypothetical protein